MRGEEEQLAVERDHLGLGVAEGLPVEEEIKRLPLSEDLLQYYRARLGMANTNASLLRGSSSIVIIISSGSSVASAIAWPARCADAFLISVFCARVGGCGGLFAQRPRTKSAPA